jgi:hypothetical protein
MRPPTSSGLSVSCIVPNDSPPGLNCCPTNVRIYSPSGLRKESVPTNEFRRHGGSPARSNTCPDKLRIFLAATNPQYTLIIHLSISMPDDMWNDDR